MSTSANNPKLTRMLLAKSEGEKRTPRGKLKVSMDACTNMAINTLPLVLLKTHVVTIAKVMAMTTNLTMSKKPLPPDDSAQDGTKNSGRCQRAHSSPRMRVPTKGPCSGCRRGSAKPRQPGSSNSGPPRMVTRTKLPKKLGTYPGPNPRTEASP